MQWRLRIIDASLIVIAWMSQTKYYHSNTLVISASALMDLEEILTLDTDAQVLALASIKVKANL